MRDSTLTRICACGSRWLFGDVMETRLPLSPSAQLMVRLRNNLDLDSLLTMQGVIFI